MTPLPPVGVPHPHVEISAGVLGGSPCIRGSRVPVRRLWNWHRRGVPCEVLFKRYPHLSRAAILDALAFAYDNPAIIEADLQREAREAGR